MSTEQNRQVVREWDDLTIKQRRPEEAVAWYLGPQYRQHNPGAADGAEPFIKFMKRFAQTYPAYRWESKRMIAEGDHVVVHGHLIREPGDRGMAVVDMFRLEDSKIVEHWDVVQEIPETSANSNTMFWQRPSSTALALGVQVSRGRSRGMVRACSGHRGGVPWQHPFAVLDVRVRVGHGARNNLRGGTDGASSTDRDPAR